jgi:hypothetical protein
MNAEHEHRAQNHGKGKLALVTFQLATGNWQLATGNWQLDTRARAREHATKLCVHRGC